MYTLNPESFRVDRIKKHLLGFTQSDIFTFGIDMASAFGTRYYNKEYREGFREEMYSLQASFLTEHGG